MKARQVVAFLLASVFVFSSSAPTAAGMPPDAAGSRVRLIRSNDREIVVELTVAGFDTVSVQVEGVTYHRLTIPEMGSTATPGSPQVPTTGVLLGVPTVDGLELQILEADQQAFNHYRLLPAPELHVAALTLDDPAADFVETYAIDPAIYGENQSFPGHTAEVGDTGFLRDQAVAQLRFYPVQYNPVRDEVRLFRRLVVRLSWPGPFIREVSAREQSSAADEGLLRNTLANYASLQRPDPLTERAAPSAGAIQSRTAPVTATPPKLKIGVTEGGIYRLTYDDLIAAGFDPGSLDAHTLQLSNRGVEIPILVQGEADQVFGSGDQILFYGTGITGDVYTEENVYWVTIGGTMGQRIASRASVDGGSSVTSFPVTRHAEADTAYWQTMPNGQGQDHWFWEDRLSPNTIGLPASRDYGFELHNLSTGAANATLRVQMKGATNDSLVNPDHSTRLLINNVEVGSVTSWDGFDVFEQVVTFTHSLLLEGTNMLRVESLDSGAIVNQLFVDWFELDYSGQYVAYGNQITFHAPAAGNYQFDVSGFGSSDISVFDVTNAGAVVQIAGLDIQPDGAGYAVLFGDMAQANTTFLALTADAYKTLTSLELDTPSDWGSATHGADYILITHSQFYTATQRLAEHRQAEGLRVAVVQIEDVYDEFNWGIFNPQAIHDFLSYAYTQWTAPAPTYVLLVGGASYDYRGKLSDVDRVNYVPTQMIETFLLGQTASDNWFVAVAGDDNLPDMFIGRLTAESVSEVDNMIDKIIDYDDNPPGDDWNYRALFVSDADASFVSSSDQLAGSLPPYFRSDKVYVSQYSDDGEATADISGFIDSGRAFVNYLGHGDPQTWGGHIYTTADVAGLSNPQRYPVVTMGNCLNGFFVGRAKPSLAEEFLKGNDHGAVAVWAPTGLGFTSGHEALIEDLYQAIFSEDQTRLGAATTTAKINLYTQSGFWGELVDTFVLFGDPATQVIIPNWNLLYLPMITRGN